MEDQSVSTVIKELDNEDKALKSLLDTFGSAFSLKEIASAFCKAGRDATLAGDILCGMQTVPPAGATHVINSEVSSKTPKYKDYDMSCYAYKNNDQASKLKRNPALFGANSSFSRKKYVWSVVGSNKSPNVTKPLKVEAHSEAPVSNQGKNCVWRIVGSNGTLNVTQPLKLEAKPVSTSEEPLLSRDASLSSSDSSSSASVVSLNDDIENILFETLGHGSLMERSAIREVLGHCGYNLKKSMETLLDRMAVTLDRRNTFERSNLHSNSENLSSENQVQKQSNEGRTMRTNFIPSRISSDSCEQADLIVSAPVSESVTRSWATRGMVTEPLNDVAENCEVKATKLHFNNLKDDAQEGSYDILRKAVKEHRETMKEYYKAAAEAFARGDRGRATLLLEKGHFFYNKAREADEESASKIFVTSGDGEMQEEMSLDLQDHNAKEAIRLVKIHLRTLSGIPMVRDLKIIIGTGDQDAEKRKRLVSKLLQREAIRWIEDETSGAIMIRLDEINPKSLSFGKK